MINHNLCTNGGATSEGELIAPTAEVAGPADSEHQDADSELIEIEDEAE